MRCRSLLATALSMLAACQSNTVTYPSLAKRPVEAQTIPPVAPDSSSAPPPATALDQASKARVDAAETASQQADEDFHAALPRVRAAAAKATTAGDEPWVQAQQLVSGLEADRARARSGLADLDALTRDLLSSGDAAKMSQASAVSAAAARIQARSDAESDILDQIERSLPGS